MALVPASLFFRGSQVYGIDSKAGAINFDLIVSESHSFDSDVSTHSVEDGSEISDHIQNIAQDGSFTGIMSN